MNVAPIRPDGPHSVPRLLLIGFLTLALAVTGGSIVLSSPASAEGFLSKIFRSDNELNSSARQTRKEIRQQRQRARPKPRKPAVRRKAVRKKQRAPVISKPAEPAREVVEKRDDARTVLVVGDFMAGNLADGLTERFADKENIRIAESDNGSSGLVRDDYFDWPARLPGLVEEKDPDVLIVMIGANDRQAMGVNGRAQPVRSSEWNDEYRRRVGEIAKVAGEAEIPLIWVGQPSYKFSSMNTDMLAFNEIYRTVVEEQKGHFVDVWEGFVDSEGNFVFTGPDVKGQMARLRNSDGINMTSAGDEKLAFYTEKALDEALGGMISGKPPVITGPELDTVKPDVSSMTRTPVYTIDDPELDGAEGLYGGIAGPTGDDSENDTAPVTSGLPPLPPKGRASDFGGTSRLPAGTIDEGDAPSRDEQAAATDRPARLSSTSNPTVSAN
ncbi:SGNH/GDSL hydrolase family protein [Notoacmeibacter ruber]|uniref:DUF459 domain-containing protein n=1 Tax=Notoacmeibacter ruber TaxID=2670375 RepID=A0A3L7JFT7_9HYPH|nr:DUF459 domain-containing protein [Notoacmeibacter ruber]RLQ88461.1 DUF459 domain-containing protein [Notoacmeibacter ruber]